MHEEHISVKRDFFAREGLPNQSVELTRASRSAQFLFVARWGLARAAHARRRAFH
jgi:hypothetical protein